MRGTILRLVMLAAFLLPACGAPENPAVISGAAMAEANRLYEEGRFAEAAARYQALVGGGVENGRLYYNLGNAYFKSGDLGRAILNYRHAQRLLPRDDDIEANLELARALARDQIGPSEEGTLVTLVRHLFDWTTVDEAAVAILVLWFTLGGLLVGAILLHRAKRPLLYAAGVVAILFVLGATSIGVRLRDQRHSPPAVVVDETVAVRSGPGEDYLVEFNLHAGAEVRIIERREGWMRIALPGDLQGWVPGDAVLAVIPAR